VSGGVPEEGTGMLCPKCGNQLPEAAEFCPGCKSPVRQGNNAQEPGQPPVTAAPELSAPEPAPQLEKSRKKLAVGLGVGLTVVLIIAVLAVCLGPRLFVKGVSAVILPGGGVVELEDLKLEFGSGDVEEPVNVRLTRLKPGGDSRPDGLLSTFLYALDIDKPIDKPVTVRIKFPASRPEKNVMIGLGAEVKGADGEDVRVVYRYVGANIVDGWAEAEVVPSDYANEALIQLNRPLLSMGVAYAQPSNLRMYVMSFDGSAFFEDGGHFMFIFPASSKPIKEDARRVLTDFEDAYRAYLAGGYIYSKRTKWPFDVYLRSISEGIFAAYEETGWRNMVLGRQPDNGFINISKAALSEGDHNILRSSIFHEWFHAVQSNYTTKGSRSEWFDEATATYHEGLVLGKIPEHAEGTRAMIFDGIYSPEDTRRAGYARALVIDFLADKFGSDDFILKAYKNFDMGIAPRDAILSATGDPAKWAGDFYESVVFGKSAVFRAYIPITLHNSISRGWDKTEGAPLYLKNSSQEEIDRASKTGETIELGEAAVDVPALGARALAVRVKPELAGVLNDGMTLRFTSPESGLDMRLFSIAVNNPANVTRITATVTRAAGSTVDVRSFKQALVNKTQYLLLVTNPSGSAKTVPVLADLVMFPTLDELVGKFDGIFQVTDVHIIDKLKADAAKQSAGAKPSAKTSGSDQGCDLDNLDLSKLNDETLKQELGKPEKTPFEIVKTGQDKGSIVLKGTDGKPEEIPFTYKNGELIVDYNHPAFGKSREFFGKIMSIKGVARAAYGANDTVEIDWTLRCFETGAEGDFYIDARLTGRHPLPANNP